MDTIFALSSGAPPAGIAVIRVTGPQAGAALQALAGKLPEPRRATRAWLVDKSGERLDDGLVVWFPAPGSVTGEDLAEFHLHGGRAVIAAVEAALAALPGLRRARPGEFTRRAFANGRIDLAEAEGLADLLSAETELQRRAAMSGAGGQISSKVEGWRERLLILSAQVEAVLDFDDEDDVGGLPTAFPLDLAMLADDLRAALAAPSAEPLREGFRVALAGPPNAGKSTLFNALLEDEAAITAATAGTTRDVLVRPVAIGGVPFSFVDMAGLREGSDDAIETIGIDRAHGEIARADLVLWLGPEGDGPPGAWEIEAQCDRDDRAAKTDPDYIISAVTGMNMDRLKQALVDHARSHLPGPGDVAFNRRQRDLLVQAADALGQVGPVDDPLILAEHLRQARIAFDMLLGRTATEDLLDSLFGRFCIGK
ncbi:tRNA uridine-5-carboxymethylaminomethyl(34) synthesis GTPase MnmE [Altererythrobacter sp. KTW20L]|uniref:tRNA uridine-5-carboxymethylaminomethyl(34) synthesis GTPase MnmE n=1 Tax=Altererythrobacter sp. KTW20L TaxID=2942210 RepID=UPI0020BE267A|nr:tRNA uridine-5-carboxymethylaminomethyl(34) synthesis GTPase MnmE [Altererythrobacter sp. KTW20L]MCL6249951.1 tRNA uridine-5-carboxymethylaminomethyl(34) synthesis GTPase MnmE [Altererythrobacter sp. KTW20L]